MKTETVPDDCTRRFAAICLVAIVFIFGGIVFAQDSATRSVASDSLALDAIFAEQHVSESGLWACDYARTLPPQQRFEFLLDWVLPNEIHRRFRITADFASATVASLGRGDTDALSVAASKHDPHIVSPAVDLMRLAQQLNQTESLRESIATIPIDSQRDVCDQAALDALLAINADEIDRAATSLDQFYGLALADNQLLDEVRQAVLLCADQAADSPRLAEINRDAVRIVLQRYGSGVKRDAWHRHLIATHAELVEQAKLRTAGGAEHHGASSQWHRVSRTRAFEHGSAFPAARWTVGAGAARNLSSQGDDFLFFASPLQGDFDVETDLTSLGTGDTQLMMAGIWVNPTADRQTYTFGSVRGQLKLVDIHPRLSNTLGHDSIHCRARIKQGVVTTFFNGRRFHDQALTLDADPWLAIRSDHRHDGGVDDLRISGTPTIPETISLVESPQLLGWYDYFQPPGNISNRLAEWKAKRYREPSGDKPITEITSPRASEMPVGSCAERLLVYTRPMLEDGTIEYEFWFTAGETITHPAVGRVCFLLESDGVKLHRLTDGRFERSMLRACNKTDAGDQDRSRRSLPLRPNTWNTMRLELKGDQLTLVLNGEAIHQQKLSTEPRQRHFGLFHFADQSSLRVRNPTWSGDWSRQLPALEDQELAVYANRFLDETADALTAVMTHRFDQESLASGRFTVVQGDPIKTVRATADGLVVERDGIDGYQDTKIAPVVRVGGDFDLTITYDQLKFDSGLDKISSLRMQVKAENDRNDLSLIQLQEGRGNLQIAECLKMQTVQGTESRHYFAGQPNQAEAGRLRLSRRGDKMYYLISDNDSTQFRLLGHETFATEDLPELGILFGVQLQGPGGSTQVRLKQIDLRAERLDGLATEDLQTLMARLNTEREQLPVHFNHDFVVSAPSEKDFDRWTDRNPWDAATGGLVINSPGTDEWTSAGISIKPKFYGDFDVSLRFQPLDLAMPKEGDRTQVYLQVELDDKGYTQLSSMLTKTSDGAIVSQGQKRTPLGDGYDYQNLGTLPIAKPDYLRVARRGTDAYFIAGVNSESREYLLGRTKTTAAPINYYGVRTLLHTGGAGRTSEMLLESVDVKAERGTVPRPATIRGALDALPRPEAPQPKAWLQSLQDLFR